MVLPYLLLYRCVVYGLSSFSRGGSMEQILTSVQNQLVKQLAGLKEKKGRDDTGLFLVEGIRFVEEALQSKAEIIHVVYSPRLLENDRGQVLLRNINKLGVPVQQVSAKVLSHIADTETPQGIAAAVRKLDRGLADVTFSNGLFIVLDEVQDPGNLGTIMRTALAAGACALICTVGTADIYNPKSLRSSMGAVFNLPFVQGVDLKGLASWLRDTQIRLLVADAQGEDVYFRANLRPPLAVAIGNEGRGVSDALVQLAAKRVRIPLQGGVESLNAGVAAALLMFESARQMAEKA